MPATIPTTQPDNAAYGESEPRINFNELKTRKSTPVVKRMGMTVGFQSDLAGLRRALLLEVEACGANADASGAGAIIASSSTGEMPIQSSPCVGSSVGSLVDVNDWGTSISEGLDGAATGGCAEGVKGRRLTGAFEIGGRAGRAGAIGRPDGTGSDGAEGRILPIGLATGAFGRAAGDDGGPAGRNPAAGSGAARGGDAAKNIDSSSGRCSCGSGCSPADIAERASAR